MKLLRTIWYVLTLRCEEADRVYAINRAEDLTLAERFGAWSHTSLCKSCRQARKQAKALSNAIDNFRERPTPIPSDARARMLDNIRKRSD